MPQRKNGLPWLLGSLALMLASAVVLAADLVSVTARYSDGSQRDFPPSPALATLLPAPTSQPTLPGMTVHLADRAAAKRGYGVGVMRGGAQRIEHQCFDGFSTNLTFENCGPVTLLDVFSLLAYRDDPAQVYLGQSLYLDEMHGPVLVQGFFGSQCGWQPGRPLTDKNQYHHIVYGNFGCKDPVFEDCVLVLGPNSGIQVRGGGTIRRCVIIDCGIGVLATQGHLVIEDSTIYGGDYYNALARDKNGRTILGDWTGMAGVAIYSAYAEMTNVAIVARVGQDAGSAEVLRDCTDRGARRFRGPAVQGSRWREDKNHPQYRPRPAGKKQLVAKGCTIAGWPGGAFGGDEPPDAQARAGFRVLPSPGTFDPGPTLADLRLRRISTPEAARRLQAGIRGSVPGMN